MSRGQSPNATLTESLEPTSQDVELLHKIVLRAQNEPHATDRDSLINAYDSIVNEQAINIGQDEVCKHLLLQMLQPNVEGDSLYEKFEHVLRDKGISLKFDDEDSTNAPSFDRDGLSTNEQSARSRSISVTSQPYSRDMPPSNAEPQPLQTELDRWLCETPPHIAQLMQVANAMDKRALFRQSLDLLRPPPRNLMAMEHTANRVYEQKLKFKVLSHWHNMRQLLAINSARADEFHAHHSKTSMFANMLDSARVNRLQAMEEERLRGMGLYKMVLASRQSIFQCNRDNRLKQRYFHRMLDAARATLAQKRELENRLSTVQSRWMAKIKQTAMVTLSSTSQHNQATNDIANEHYNSGSKAKVLRQWFPQVQQIIHMQTTAESARRLYLMKKYFSKIWDLTQVKKVRRAILARRCITMWRDFVKRKKRQRFHALYRECRRNIKMTKARRRLEEMMTKVQSIQNLQQVAEERYQTKCNQFVHAIVVSWYNKSQQLKRFHEDAVEHSDKLATRHAIKAISDKHQQVNQLQSVADQFQDIRVQSVSARCLKAMSRKMFEVRRRQQDADAVRARHDKQMIRSHLDQMRRKLAENRGEGPLVLPPATPAQRRADQLNRLASTTPLIAPRTSFAARLRGEVGTETVMEVDVEDEDEVFPTAIR